MKELSLVIDRLRDPTVYPAALATLVQVEGSSYRRAGARLLLGADGLRSGSISGGCLEEDLLERAKQVIATDQPQLAIYDTTSENDLVWGVGLGCHGIVRVLIEPLGRRPDWVEVVRESQRLRRDSVLEVSFEDERRADWGTRLAPLESDPKTQSSGFLFDSIPPPVLLLIFGAGDDAQPLVRLSKELGWIVHVIDPRKTFATSERFPEADQVTATPIASALASLTTDARTAAVIMTHHYVHDLPLLSGLLGRPLVYLGLLGPRKRAERLLADIEKTGRRVSAEEHARLHAPVGLDLGGDTPESVALAIVAELQAALAGRDARPLRERQRPIHQ